jgi:dolichyl-phosphate-mannose-protein mannosyltransferase
LYNSTGFFFLTWAAHYIPFFIMGRQLFLHHYLPAHLASALVTGALIEFIFNLEPADVASIAKEGGKTITKGPRNKPIRERIAGQSLLATWAVLGLPLLRASYLRYSRLECARSAIEEVAQL